MMAEQKFYEAQRLIEVNLTAGQEYRHELLTLLLETLSIQNKKLSPSLILELAEFESHEKKFSSALDLIHEISAEKFLSRVTKIKALAFEDKGQMELLYKLHSEFLVKLFESQIPVVPEWLNFQIEKYYKSDYSLKLKMLGLSLLRNDFSEAESLVKFLIRSCTEKNTLKAKNEKILSIGQVLKSSTQKAQLEIYQNFCFIYTQGLREKSDLKRVIEMIIYFEDFQLQVLVLDLIHQYVPTLASDFAESVRKHHDYDYVYLDKYFAHLKPYFFKMPKAFAKKEEPLEVDLQLTSKPVTYAQVIPDAEESEEESALILSLKYQNHTSDELCEIAVSFFQSDFPKAALHASSLALAKASEDKSYLKASYLKLSALLLLKDYRAALDTCLEALNKTKSSEDILSFLYGQAEALIRLNKKKQAKDILKRIIAIDSGYRMARERLDKLNEI